MPFAPTGLGGDVDLRVVSAETFELLSDLVYDGRDERFVIRRGFVTDLASVPRPATIVIPRYGTYTRAAVFHDYLCVEAHAGRFARRDADGIFRRVLREEGVHPVLRWTLWAAVRIGGHMDGADTREWLQVAGIGAALLLPPVVAVAGASRLLT